MPTERSTKEQVQAYRYGVRRVTHAVGSGSSLPPGTDTARPGLFILIGAVLAGVILAGFGVYGFLRPKPSIEGAQVLVDSQGGGVYVMRDGVAHPAMNLASAMLAASADSTDGGATTPVVRSVTTQTLAEVPKGQLLGIPGAPSQLPGETDLVASNSWQVCDVVDNDPAAAPGTPGTMTTTVVIGQPGTTPGADDTAFLVRTDSVQGTWLVQSGHRSSIDLADSALVAGLGLDPSQVRTVSMALLNAIPEQPALTRPQIPLSGRSITFGDSALTIGEVLAVTPATGGTDYQLVLQDGIQQISPVVADVIQATSGRGETARTVAPATLADAPVTQTPLDVVAWPTTAPRLVSPTATPGLCLDWRENAAGSVVRVDPVSEVPLPSGAKAVPAPPGADRDARSGLGLADQMYVAPGQGIVAALASSGAEAGSGSLVLITDQGIAYPVVSNAALTALGLTTTRPAPAELVSLLPMGPVLDPEAARQYFTAGAATGG